MKRLLSIILSILVFISITFGVEFNVYASYQIKYEYCDICQREGYYFTSNTEIPIDCTEEVHIVLDCGHRILIRAAGEHNFWGHIFSGSEYINYECRTCGEWYSEKLSEHKCEDFFWYPTDVEPSCEWQGRIGGKQCKGCKAVYDATYTPALGHKMSSMNDGKRPTCTEDGYYSTRECIRDNCNYVEKGEVRPALGHDFSKSVTTKITTCTVAGEKTQYCSRCDKSETIEIPATGHTTKTTGKKSATYFVKGHTGKTVCKDCGEVISKGKSTAKLKLKTPTAKYTGGKKKLTVRYTKVSGATGFQVKYKLGKKSVTKTYNTKKSATKTIKNLKKGTYKVQVRAFVKSGNQKAYSSWSKLKSVKVK